MSFMTLFVLGAEGSPYPLIETVSKSERISENDVVGI